MKATFTSYGDASEATRKAIEKASADLALRIEIEARQDAPVDTGELKSSIKSTSKGGDATVEVGAEHGIYVEYGTKYQQAQPFFEPAVDKINKIADKVIKQWCDTELSGELPKHK